MTEGGSDQVDAQWALQGKTLGRGGYRVLACSTGGLTMENFTTAIGRFSMGTPEKQPNALPQVTISYLRHEEVNLSLAIHRLASDAYPDGQLTATDDDGRPVVATSFYCVPYTPVAQRSVTYRDMYRAFAAAPLRPGNGPVLPVEMPAAPATPEQDAVSPLAIQAAALLLTGRPVCVLGATLQTTSMTDRLGFIDTVMSLLPYGFRAKMTAATWTRATNESHRFRLFFSGARRDVKDPDHVVVWGHPEQTALDRSDSYAYDYFNWLSTGPVGEKLSLLAGLRQPRSLAIPAEVIAAFGAINKAARPPVPLLLRRSIFPFRARTGPDRSADGPGPAQDATPPARSVIESLLLECAQCMEEADSRRLGGAIGQLKRQPRSAIEPGERDRCRELIREHRLFRHDALPAKDEEALHEVLLDIAFEPPLSYEDYCLIEDALGEGDAPNPSLLHRIDKQGADDRVKAITYRQLPDGDMGKKLRTWYKSTEVTACGLLNLLAFEAKRPLHMWLLCEVATDYFKQQSTSLDPAENIERVLHEHSYLAGQLQRSRVGDHQYQYDTLGTFLRAAYPNGITRDDLFHVLRRTHDPVTFPFLAAVILTLADAADAPLAFALFSSHSLALMGFDGLTTRALTPFIVIHEHPAPRSQQAPSSQTEAAPRVGQAAPADGQPDGTSPPPTADKGYQAARGRHEASAPRLDNDGR